MKKATLELREYRKAIRELEQAWKDPHHERCGRCHDVSFMALLEGDTGDLRLAAQLCQKHARSGEDYGMPKCEPEGCVLHEEISFPLARRLLKLNRGEMGGEDGRGRKIATFELARHGEHPEDVNDEDPGYVLLRFTRRKVTAHVHVSPAPEGGREAHPLEAIARGWDLHFKRSRDWALGRHRECLQLALADLELDPPKKRELRAPFSPRRRRP